MLPFGGHEIFTFFLFTIDTSLATEKMMPTYWFRCVVLVLGGLVVNRRFWLQLAAWLGLFLASSATTSAQTYYAVSGAGNAPSNLYTFDPLTGAATLVGATGFSHVTGLAIDPTTGNLFGHVSDIGSAGGVQLISIDKNTGAGTLIGSSGHQIPDMTFRADGQLFGWAEVNASFTDSDFLVTIDKITGSATKVGVNGTGTFQTGLSFAPDGTLYLKVNTTMHTVDPNTGATTFLMFLTGDDFPLRNALLMTSNTEGFSIDRRDGTTFLFGIDLDAGTYTQIGDMGFGGIAALAFDATVIPEPATIALAGLMGSGIVLGVRRVRAKRRSKQAK